MTQRFLTHATGAPVADNLNVQTAGPRGPVLLRDIWLIEELAPLDLDGNGDLVGNDPPVTDERATE